MHNLFVYIIAFIVNCCTILGQIHFTVLYGDLEADYINPIELCSRINKLLFPESMVQLFGTVLFLLTGNFFSAFINLPITAYNVNKIVNKQQNLDATDIFRTLSKHKKESFLKLAFYVFLFFFYLWKLVFNIIDYTH